MIRRLALAGCAALLLAGCSATDDDTPVGASADGSFPTSVENCGEKVIVDAAPQRIVSLNQGTTEVLLSLGLADRMVGTATWTDPVLDSLAADNEKVKRLADNAPSFEAVLAEEPDFVTASFSSTLGKGGVATRKQFADFGVPTYLAPSDCEGKVANGGDGARDQPVTLDAVYKEIDQIAQLTGVPDKGTALVDDLKAKVTAARDSVHVKDVSVLYWFANSESPYMAGCCGAPGIIDRELGLHNVFDDTTDEWPQINWEVVADRNPDVLVIGDLTRKSQTAETAEAKIAFLESNPVTREMDAVKNKRYIEVTGAEMNPSLRTVYGIQTVADGLKKLGLAD